MSKTLEGSMLTAEDIGKTVYYIPPHAKLDFDNSKPSELNRDETPNQVEGGTNPLGGKV